MHAKAKAKKEEIEKRARLEEERIAQEEADECEVYNG